MAVNHVMSEAVPDPDIPPWIRGTPSRPQAAGSPSAYCHRSQSWLSKVAGWQGSAGLGCKRRGLASLGGSQCCRFILRMGLRGTKWWCR
jgi:hypothetical protein